MVQCFSLVELVELNYKNDNLAKADLFTLTAFNFPQLDKLHHMAGSLAKHLCIFFEKSQGTGTFYPSLQKREYLGLGALHTSKPDNIICVEQTI